MVDVELIHGFDGFTHKYTKIENVKRLRYYDEDGTPIVIEVSDGQ